MFFYQGKQWKYQSQYPGQLQRKDQALDQHHKEALKPASSKTYGRNIRNHFIIQPFNCVTRVQKIQLNKQQTKKPPKMIIQTCYQAASETQFGQNFLFTQTAEFFKRRQAFNKGLILLEKMIDYRKSGQKNHIQKSEESQINIQSGFKSRSPYAIKKFNKFSKSLQLKKTHVTQRIQKTQGSLKFSKIPCQALKTKNKYSKNMNSTSIQTLDINARNNEKKIQQFKKIEKVSNHHQNKKNRFLLRNNIIDEDQKNDKQSKNSNRLSELISKESSLKRSKKSENIEPQNELEEYEPPRQKIKFVRYGKRTQSCKPVKRMHIKQSQIADQSYQKSIIHNQDLSLLSNSKQQDQKDKKQQNSVRQFQRTSISKSKKKINFCRGASYNNQSQYSKQCSHKSQSSIDTLELFTQCRIKYPKQCTKIKNKEEKQAETAPGFLVNSVKDKQTFLSNFKILKKQSNISDYRQRQIKGQINLNKKQLFLRNQKISPKLKRCVYVKQQESKDHQKLSQIKKNIPNQQQDRYPLKEIKGNGQDVQNQQKIKLKKGKQEASIRQLKRLKLKRIQSYNFQVSSSKKSNLQIVKKPTQRNSIIKVHKNSFTLKKIMSSHFRDSRRVIFIDQKEKAKQQGLPTDEILKFKTENCSIRAQTRRKGTFYSNYSIKDMISEDYSEYNSESEDDQEGKQEKMTMQN